MRARHFISVDGHGAPALQRIVRDAVDIAAGRWDGRAPLASRSVGIYFRGTSTRTRTSFTIGASRLGASVISYGPADLQLVTGETVADTGRVLACYLDALVVRTNASVDEMWSLGQGGLSIINAMSSNEHPTQAMADLAAMQEAFGRLEGLHVLYIGEGNNSAASLALAIAHVAGMKLTLVTPPGYGLAPAPLARARELAASHGAAVEQHHDMRELPSGVDVVYTTRWLTMGVVHEDPDWLSKFRPYTVDGEVMRRVSRPKGTIFMHDLPAMRGHEVTDEVLDGAQSIAFRQAFHKLTAAMAVLHHCVAEPSA